MEDKKITLLLNAEEAKELEMIRKRLNATNEDDAVRLVIKNFVEISNQNEKQEKEIERLKKEAEYFRQVGYALMNFIKEMIETFPKQPEMPDFLKKIKKNN